MQIVSSPLHAERLDHEPRHRATRILLLSGNEVAVANRVRLETSGYDEIRACQLFRLILDMKRLNALAHEFVGVLLFGIGKAGPGLARDNQLAIHLGLQQEASGVAKDSRDLAGPVELRRQIVDTLVVVKRVHRRLPANEEKGVVVRNFQLADGLRVLDNLGALRGADK